MNDDEFVPPPEDPFTANDPAAHERQRRRLQREAKRRERSGRASLAERVSGALDGAATKGREAVEQGKERIATPPTPPADGAEPPPLRRTAASTRPAAPAAATPDAAAAPAPPSPAPAAAPSTPRTVIHTETDEFGAPAPIAVERHAGGPPPPPTGEGPAVPAGVPAAPPPRRTLSSGAIWRRRLLALGFVVLLAAAVYAAFSIAGGDDPEPVAKGPRTLKTSSVTIPEGLTEDEMAAVAKDAGLKGGYDDATRRAAKKFDFDKAGAPNGTSTLEGFLFPATYELERGAPADDLVGKQLEAFDSNFAEVDLSYAKRKKLTTYDIVTIASMIEREVQVPEERELVAAVIYNRLEQGIPLGIDATVRYALGNDFTNSLTESDLQVDSPYNTYRFAGLPAGPIGNPGLSSLEAAANPSNDDYLYYVVKPGTCGEHTFTESYEEFEAASAEYDAAQAAAGGSPTEC